MGICISKDLTDKLSAWERREQFELTPGEKVMVGLQLVLAYDTPQTGRSLVTYPKVDQFEGINSHKLNDEQRKEFAKRKDLVAKRLPELLMRTKQIPLYTPVIQAIGSSGHTKVLVLLASPSTDSTSVRLVDAFIEKYCSIHPSDRIYVMDLFRTNLPAFDEIALNYRNHILTGEQLPKEVEPVWQNIEMVIREFRSADKIVIACPMWNFGIPYRLKQYIDLVTQPKYTFVFNTQGFQATSRDKSAFVVYTRGSDYANKPFLEHQDSYLDQWLTFIGFNKLDKVVVEPTDMGNFRFRQGYEAAHEKLLQVAERF
eukprot:GFYU01010433.1.p1 GENE.GFYU01010433.1~~GFYU01010433.1.p1  ORF type:complete len:314 (-),score=89.46 GFYU01010433.1:356-1297(-)